MNVKSRAQAVGTFRHVNVRLMETLAGWIPATPEMEAKILLGRHLWLFAQTADRLGKRARELRAPLHFDRAPAPAYARAIAALSDVKASASRMEALYAIALASLERAYRGYLARTDSLIDEPTVVILEEALRDVDRMRRERANLPEALQAEVLPETAGLRALFDQAPDLVAAAAETQPA